MIHMIHWRCMNSTAGFQNSTKVEQDQLCADVPQRATEMGDFTGNVEGNLNFASIIAVLLATNLEK